ncbi:MAG: class I SAM-dependent methyltransferase [Lachnospiraceae bacterium]|nr:class I SAM-dependent methyltransferase [Lachnospiraceae bacterium]
MGKLIVENNAFIYVEKEEKKVLLDCRDYLSNKSRIPMHSFTDDLTIPGLLLQLFKSHPQLCEGAVDYNDSLECLLMDVLLVSHLIKSPNPVRVLEIGCENGILSYHLAMILGLFNENSSLCCVCNTIGNNSDNRWLDKISLVEFMPRISMLAADYDETNLESKHFDIVIINGTSCFMEPLAMIEEAMRLVKDAGRVICYVNQQPLLESSFKMQFEKREEYFLTAQTTIMVVVGQEEGWIHSKEIKGYI